MEGRSGRPNVVQSTTGRKTFLLTYADADADTDTDTCPGGACTRNEMTPPTATSRARAWHARTMLRIRLFLVRRIMLYILMGIMVWLSLSMRLA